MKDNFEFFFSNHLEALYQQLKQRLFGSSPQPFKRRLVVVYGPAMKAWLMQQMAQDSSLGIAAGIEIVYSQEIFENLINLFQMEPHRYIPSSIELACAIEQEIFKVVKSFQFFSEKEQEDWSPLVQYLKLDTHSSYPRKLSRKAERRVIGLSQQIANCFLEYGRYAGDLIKQWDMQTHKGWGWQQRLWKNLFNKHQEWTYFCSAFQQPLIPITNTELHFFSISFINQNEFQFLRRISDYVPIYYYLLSPCAVFWSDIRSDRESAYLQTYWQQKLGASSSQVSKLEELLRDRNPLLANFGRLGREMAYQIEESSATTTACYFLPTSVKQLDQDLFENEDLHFLPTDAFLTLLNCIQADILLMRNPQNRPRKNLDYLDTSIQLHIVSNKRREIEILYNNLLSLIEKDPTICPNDIIVMAPQITEYMPYIHSLFGSEESLLDFQILDLGLHNQSDLVQGFLQLLELSTSRWDAGQLLQLFEHRSFQRRHQLTQGDYDLIQQWIESTGIRWGETFEHRNEMLQRDHCTRGMVEDTEVGTWDYGIARLLIGLTTTLKAHKGQGLDVPPSDQVDLSQSELLGKWIRLMHALKDDLSPLHDGSHLTLEDWVNYLYCLLENYFQIDLEDSQSLEDFEGLTSQFETLRSCSRALPTAQFSFASIRTHLHSLLQQKGMIYRENHLQTVRFCSMMPLRSIPAKVVYLIGMHEGAFPRQNQQSSLNLSLQHEGTSYCPTPVDYDRNLFLEALHSAQNYFIISYQGYSQKDGKELQPSLLVEELFSYLNKYYSLQEKTIQECCVFRHPFDSFNKNYFVKESVFSNFSSSDFKAAQAYYIKSKKPPHRFLHDFTLINHETNVVIPPKTTIDLKHLAAVARNPIKFYLNKVLEVYLQTDEDRRLKNDEELIVSPLDRYVMKRDALKQPIHYILQRAEKEGKLPLGLFKTVASDKFKEEVEDIYDRLKKHSIKPEDIFHIEFCTSCSAPTQISESYWLFPALPVSYSNGHQIHIVGELSNVTPKGLLSMSKATLSEVWKTWPQFLVYQYATKLHPQPLENQLILAYHSKPKKAFFDDPEPYLKQFIDYYGLCLKNFSPLIPDWIPLILDDNSKGIQDKMRQLFTSTSFGSEYQSLDLKWILNKDRLPCTDKMLEYWKDQAQLLLGDLIRNWYASKDE